jgi:hypothetical protein
MWSDWPEGTTGRIQGSAGSRIASMCSPTCSIVHAGWYTPRVSATKARATRPAIDTSISPLTEQDSWASQAAAGAASSGPIGG